MVGKKIHCLIIGGAGFIGSQLSKNLTDKGHKVSIIDPSYNYFDTNPKTFENVKKFRQKYLLKSVEIISQSFQDVGKELIKKNRYNAIIHLAAHACDKPLGSSMASVQITDDVELTYSIVNALKYASSDTKFVFMSSSAVYGNYDFAATESLQPDPKSVYGISKAAGEFLVKSNVQNWNIVRANATYGIWDLGDRATHILAEKAFKKEVAWVNDSVWCDFIYVKDLAEGIAEVIVKAPSKEIFHISSGKAQKLLTYAEEINKYLHFSFKTKSLNDRPKRGALDNSKALRILGWSPQFDLEAGVKDYIKLVKKYKAI